MVAGTYDIPAAVVGTYPGCTDRHLPAPTAQLRHSMTAGTYRQLTLIGGWHLPTAVAGTNRRVGEMARGVGRPARLGFRTAHWIAERSTTLEAVARASPRFAALRGKRLAEDVAQEERALRLPQYTPSIAPTAANTMKGTRFHASSGAR